MTACEHGWHFESDCDICRPSRADAERLRERIAELQAALRPFIEAAASAVSIDGKRTTLRIDMAAIAAARAVLKGDTE